MKAFLKDVGTKVLVRVLTRVVLAALTLGVAVATGIDLGL